MKTHIIHLEPSNGKAQLNVSPSIRLISSCSTCASLRFDTLRQEGWCKSSKEASFAALHMVWAKC